MHLTHLLSHPLARTQVDHVPKNAGTQVRRYASRYVVSVREVPRSARPINSICPTRPHSPSGSGSCPTSLPCQFSLSLSIKGSFLPHFSHTRSLLAHCRPTFKHNHRLLSALGGHILNPGQTFNLSRVHQLFSPRCVASPLDAMRCDTI